MNDQPTPPRNADEFTAAVAEAQARIHEAASTATFAGDDYRHVLAAMSIAIGLMARHAQWTDTIVREMESRLDESDKKLAGALAAVTAAVEKVKHPALNPETTQELVRVVRGIAHEWGREAGRAIRHQTISGVALIGAAIALASCGGGYLAGRISARTETRAMIAAERVEIETEVRNIVLTLPKGLYWARLIANNDIIVATTAAQTQTDAAGRRFALVPLWLDPPRPPATH